jgi:ABC-type cobalamin/Fe3+-siderophores transport system ATPase subunit
MTAAQQRMKAVVDRQQKVAADRAAKLCERGERGEREEVPVKPALSKEQIIQQQIKNVYLQTMQKIQQMSQVYQVQQAHIAQKLVQKGASEAMDEPTGLKISMTHL